MQTVFNYEKEAAEIIARQSHVLLFDAMGVGKTVSVLEGLKKVSEGFTGPLKCVVCAPNTILGQWSDEISNWLGGSDFHSVIALGDKATREVKYNYFNSTTINTVLLTNYLLLVKDKFFVDVKADVLILDEGYIIRNNHTKAYKFLKTVMQNFNRVIVLSGNIDSFNDKQFYDIVSLVFPGQFIKCPKNELQKALGENYISRDFNAVSTEINVPLQPQVVEVPLSLSELQNNYLGQLAIIENRAKKFSGYKPKEFYYKKLAVLNTPRILNKDCGLSPKELFLKNKLDSITGKVVIYCQDKNFFKILKSDLNNWGINYKFVSGEIPVNIRDRNIRLFNNDDSVKCLLISGVGKYGLNLQVANTLICMGVPKSKFDLGQMLGRLNRVNQKNQVVCYIPYHIDTNEQNLIGVYTK